MGIAHAEHVIVEPLPAILKNVPWQLHKGLRDSKAMQSSVSTTGFATGTKGKFEENGTLHSVAKWSCWSCNGTDM
eukprot:m.119513 g.119513  ORF g.119513 m.119513 type:complete len:75 (+) comp15596_c0_seq1:1502-1726(+)